LLNFQKICPEVSSSLEVQQISAVKIIHWKDKNSIFTANDIADIVIEFFGCHIPSRYIVAMSERVPRPIWINLEGLSAESWVELCHKLSSPQPHFLMKHFFFPGFSKNTGGLLLESGLLENRKIFQSNPEIMRNFLQKLNVTALEMESMKISMFCYDQAPVPDLFKAWKNDSRPITCLVPEGVATHSVERFLNQSAKPGVHLTQGSLTVRVIPFISQAEYDKLLWACDLNFVRGEDSFVRAQWARKPFIWHIYQQDKNYHHIKLEAFFQRCTFFTSKTKAVDFLLAWNQVFAHPIDWTTLWPSFVADISGSSTILDYWEKKLLENGDLASNLLTFITKLVCKTIK